MVSNKEKLQKVIKDEISRFQIKVKYFSKLSRNYSTIRFIVFLLFTILFLGLYISGYKSSAFLSSIILGTVFVLLMINHNKVENSLKTFSTFIQIKKEYLARLCLDWKNIPKLYVNYIQNPTYLENDLNITEENGLLQLISTGLSIESVDILRVWLSGNSNDTGKIKLRQKIIAELKELTRFRTRLLLTSKLSITKKLAKSEISDWINRISMKKGLKLYTIFLTVLVLFNYIALFGWAFGIFNSFYYQFLMIYVFFYFAGMKYLKDIHYVSEFLYDEISKYSSIFEFIEKYNYGRSIALKNYLEPFLSTDLPPSKSLKRIRFTIEILNLRKNPFVWFFLTCIVPIDYLISINVEKFKQSIKKDLPIWLDTWHNLEAYCSFAGFAYLNPDYKFPEHKANSNLLEAKNLGHPLIKFGDKIENDFSISDASLTNIITGSNMSGKSTFLRTIGCNILLANAGSVVNADSFIISNFNLFTCIKVSDSVVDGISYFYSEVKRLKEIINYIEESNTVSLVLIDEIYKGTNNIERIIGSKALIKYFSNENIYSIVSTHDLELVKIADDRTKVKNYHFKELISEDKMIFDFKLREGPCPTTNALKIMKREGLPT